MLNIATIIAQSDARQRPQAAAGGRGWAPPESRSSRIRTGKGAQVAIFAVGRRVGQEQACRSGRVGIRKCGA
eukprot:7960391-Pyramimonas_sp.AAC.1